MRHGRNVLATAQSRRVLLGDGRVFGVAPRSRGERLVRDAVDRVRRVDKLPDHGSDDKNDTNDWRNDSDNRVPLAIG